MTDHLISADQNIPDWLIKMTFLEKMEAAIRASINVVFSLTVCYYYFLIHFALYGHMAFSYVLLKNISYLSGLSGSI